MDSEKPSRLPKRIKDYAVVRELGRGGMGEVFLATHDLLERPVAIKRFTPATSSGADQKNRERFLREGKALSKLRHQGIVGIYDLFEHRSQLCMVLEYVEGFDVAKLLSAGPLPVDVACIVALKLAEALVHAHFHRIIHRDVKTTNVMVSWDGQVKLMDFGIARGEVLDRITQTGLLVGTPQYFAPEVVSGHPADELSDLYGIGAVLYHCLSGRKLFFQASDKNLYKSILAGKFVPLGKVTKGVPRALLSIVQRCLARKPEKRFESVADFRHTLDLFMATQGYWVNHSERLAGFMRALDHLKKDPPQTSVDISLSDFLIKSTSVGEPPQVFSRWLLIGIVLAAVTGFLAWGAYAIGWLTPVLRVLGIDAD